MQLHVSVDSITIKMKTFSIEFPFNNDVKWNEKFEYCAMSCAGHIQWLWALNKILEANLTKQYSESLCSDCWIGIRCQWNRFELNECRINSSYCKLQTISYSFLHHHLFLLHYALCHLYHFESDVILFEMNPNICMTQFWSCSYKNNIVKVHYFVSSLSFAILIFFPELVQMKVLDLCSLKCSSIINAVFIAFLKPKNLLKTSIQYFILNYKPS